MRRKGRTEPKAASAEQEPLWERNAGALLAAILLFALCLRIAALADLSRSIYIDFMLWDERVYHDIAVRIANGTYDSRSVYEFAPLFAYLMAGVYRLFSPDIFAIRIVNIGLGVLTCWAVYGIGSRLGGKKAGLTACLLAALYEPMLFYSIVPLKETLAVCLFAATAWALLEAIAEPRPSAAGLTGAAAGLLLNVRPNAVLLIPVLAGLIVWFNLRDGASWRRVAAAGGLFILGLGLVVAPFAIRNYVRAGKVALTTTQSGFNLYLGNNLQNPDPYYRPVPFASSSPFEQGVQFTIEASRRSGKVLTSPEASDFWTKEAFRQLLAQPGAAAWKLLQKSFALVNRFEACDHYDIGFVSRFVPFFRLPFPGFGLVFPLAMVALGRRLGSDRKAIALALILTVYAATIVLFFPNGRYRVPMVPLLIPFAALALFDLGERLQRRQLRTAGLYGAAVLGLAVVECLPVQATDDLSAYYNTHAIILDSRGFENEAILYWQQSSGMNRPFSAFANLALAQKFFRRGRVGEGTGYLGRIPDSSFAAAPKYELMGDLYAAQKRIDEAARAYERSLAINSGQRRTLFKLIQIHRRTDPQKAIAEEARLRYLDKFYEAMP